MTIVAIGKTEKAALFAYECVNKLAPYLFKGYYQKVSHGKGKREDAVSLKLPSTKLEVFRKRIQFQGGWPFNKLPSELKAENSVLHFKN